MKSFRIINLAIVIFLFYACTPTVPIRIDETNIEATSTIENISSSTNTPIVVVITVIVVATNSADSMKDTAQATEVNTSMATLSATTTVTPGTVGELVLCNSKIPTNCIYTIRQAANKTLTIYFNISQDQAADYYLIYDSKKYEMESIAGYEGKKFACRNFPLIINRTVHLQIFSSQSNTLILEGDIYFDRALIFPTETPKPPEPYRP